MPLTQSFGQTPLAQCQAVSLVAGVASAGAYYRGGNRQAARQELVSTVLSAVTFGRGRLGVGALLAKRSARFSKGLRTWRASRASRWYQRSRFTFPIRRRHGGLMGVAVRQNSAAYARSRHRMMGHWMASTIVNHYYNGVY